MIYGFLATIVVQVALCFSSMGRGFKYAILNPTQLVLGIFYIYCYLGVTLYWQGTYIFNHYDYSNYINAAYYVLTVMIVSFYFGQLVNQIVMKKKIAWKFKIHLQDFDIINNKNISYTLTILSILIIIGFLLSLIYADSYRFLHAVRNYIKMLFDSLIVVCLMLFVIGHRWRWFILTCYTLISVYLGFRFRLAILLMAFLIYRISALEKFTKKTLIDFIILVSVGLGLIAVLGVTRVYNDVPNLSMLTAYSVYETIVKGVFNDTSTILVLGTLVQYLDLTNQFAGFNQLVYVISSVLPSDIFPNKIYSPILDLIVQSTPNPEATFGSGAAVPLVGEFYHTAGIFGVIGFSFFFGYVLSAFFIRSLLSGEAVSKIRLVAYACIMSWFLNSLTRGYFAQNTLDFFTILLGLCMVKFTLGYNKTHHG